jgi:hypothetical protein
MIIGLAGTAKNTGKTTALCALIDAAITRGHLPGVTGIGYDGEERDNVTMLPKPRITVSPGMIVTTSERCLTASTARLRVLKRTGCSTALGEIVITVAETQGLAVVAGPNKTTDLSMVARQMAGFGVANLLVDGSLNRIAPMVIADRVVLATGGARTTNIGVLAEETAAITRIFSYPLCSADYALVSGLRFVGEDVQMQMGTSAFHGAVEMRWALDHQPAGLREIIIPGMIAEGGLALLCDRLVQAKASSVDLIFDNPFTLILAGDPMPVGGILARLEALSCRLSYRGRTSLAAVTFNPYYPAFDGTTYRAAYLDAADGRAALASTLAVPVIDVVRDGGDELFSRCFDD